MARRKVRSGRRVESMSTGFGRIVVPGLVLIAMYYAVFGGQYSVFDLSAARSSAEVEQAKLTELQSEIDSMRSWADSLQTDDATVERIAREEFGMIREGETLYRFAESEPGNAQEVPTPER